MFIAFITNTKATLMVLGWSSLCVLFMSLSMSLSMSFFMSHCMGVFCLFASSPHKKGRLPPLECERESA